MTEKQERKLIQRIRKRQDRQAADVLVTDYYREIYAYVFRRTEDQEQAKDITQEIFLGMLKSLWSYDERKASFRTWLYRIATYKIVDYFRSVYHSTKNCAALEDLDIPEDSDLEHTVTDRQLASAVFSYLQQSDRILEEIFQLKFYGDYTFAQIGEILEIPESTVKTKYYSALKQIRKQFGISTEQ